SYQPRALPPDRGVPLAVDLFTEAVGTSRGSSDVVLVYLGLGYTARKRLGPSPSHTFSLQLAANLTDALGGAARVGLLYRGSSDLLLVGTAARGSVPVWVASLPRFLSGLLQEQWFRPFAVGPKDLVSAATRLAGAPAIPTEALFDEIWHDLLAHSSPDLGPWDLGTNFEPILRGGRLRLAQQPIVDLRTGEVVGYEALIRGPSGSPWEKPGPLFAAATRAGAFEQLEAHCREVVLAYGWKGLKPSQRLFMNVSLRNPLHNLVERLEQRGLDPALLVLEISEATIFDDPRRIAEELQLCREAGIGIALDDVGRGFTGLPVLAAFPWNYLKIDGSLIAQAREEHRFRSLLTLLLDYAADQGMTVIAEGIETEPVRSFCAEMGIPLAQGYLLGRPRTVRDGV
ncbi:MAG: EAL domain-containing protein, partial [Clostridia bacterium]|nr:EAL domain-containing protein [Clostridia bacterium]